MCNKGTVSKKEEHDTPRLYRKAYKSLADKKGFPFQMLPDSGASMLLISGFLVDKYKVTIIRELAVQYKLLNASGEDEKIILQM